MRKITISLVFTLLVIGSVYGQQDPQYTQYMYNQNVINPAYAGSRGDLSIGILGRTQWVGISGAPETQTLNVHGAMTNRVGLGLSVIHDNLGPVEESNLALDFSYTIPVSRTGNLAFGLKGSFSFLSIDFKKLILEHPNDPAFAEDYSGSYPNIGAGIYYYTDKFYIGAATPAILENYTYETDGGFKYSDVSDKMHIFATAGFVFDLSNRLKLKPSTMVKMVEGAPLSLDLNASLYINEIFEIGVSFREGDSIDGLIGLQVSPTIRVGYAYDHTITNLGDYNSGTHELMLLFDLDFMNKRYIKSPRFF